MKAEEFELLLTKTKQSTCSSDDLYRLACHYQAGIGTTRNHKEAIRYLTLAADHNHAQAQNDIGALYFQGAKEARIEVIKAEPEKGITWLIKAAENESACAQFNLGKLYLLGYPMADIKKDLKKARGYLVSAAKQNNADALYYLGTMCRDGLVDGKQDINKAKFFFEEAIIRTLNGHPEAKQALEKLTQTAIKPITPRPVIQTYSPTPRYLFTIPEEPEDGEELEQQHTSVSCKK